MVDQLLLLSGVDIPFPSARLSIHQPTLKEIAYIGEVNFFVGCELLQFSKTSLNIEAQRDLEDQTNFDIVLTLLREKRGSPLSSGSYGAKMVLLLLFPDYTIQFRADEIRLTKTKITEGESEQEVCSLNKDNYDSFVKILVDMFCLREHGSGDDYNPQSELARKIADKLRAGRRKRAALEGNKAQQASIFGRYASVLAVGECKDLNSLMNYTVFQIYDEFQRFNLKDQADLTIRAKLAGASGVKDAENWMKDLYEKK